MSRFEIVDDKPPGRFQIVDAPAPGFTDRTKALATGVNRGFYADLLGMPTDAIANVLDLAKAGVGYTTSKVTGKAPPDWTEPFNRTQVPLTADWIAQKISQGSNAVGVASPVDNPNPQDAQSRILFSGGRVAGGSIVPNPNAKISLARNGWNMVKGGTAGLLGGTTAEVAPDYAGLATMMPGAAGQAGRALGGKIMGGEGRQAVTAQRLQDFKNAGVDNPSLGLATGSPLIMGLENLLSKLPGSVGTYQTANAANFAGMRDRIAGLRDLASPQYGPTATGAAITQDLTSTAKGANTFPNKISGTYDALMQDVMNTVGQGTRIPVNNTISAATNLTTPNPLAPNVSSIGIQPKITGIRNAFVADNGGTPGTNVLGLAIPGSPPVGVPFGIVKDQRSNVGREISSPDTRGTPIEGQYKRLYAAMSDDLGQGVAVSDMLNNRSPGDPGSATRQWDRSNNYYSAASDRADKFGPVVNRQTPEAVYQAYLKSAEGNLSTLQAVKKSILPETRGMTAASILDDMGAANSSQQNNLGNVFSPDSFLTRYDKMGPGRNELFSGFPNSDAVRSGVNDVATGSSMLRDASKIWANPSGTAPNLAAASASGSIVGNLFTHPMAAAGGLAGLLSSNQLSKRVLLNPDVVERFGRIGADGLPSQAIQQSDIQRMILGSGLPGLLDY